MLDTHQFYLENDLKVILVPLQKSPVVSVQVWVDTGSADEPEHLAGISHFIEHLVFKGTKSYAMGEVATAIEGSGGLLNAYTSFDVTVFFVTLSSDYLKTGLKVLSEMMSSPRFEEKEIDAERGVVIEEIKRSLDSPSRQVSREIFSTMYKDHTYGRPVIGYEDVVNNVSREEIASYFLEHYNSSNMTLVVSGDFDVEEARKKIQEEFAQLAKDPARGQGEEKVLWAQKRKFVSQKEHKINDTTIEVSADQRIKLFPRPFKESVFQLTWPTPHIRHKDIPALEVFSILLGGGENSRLMKRLRFDSGVANYAVSELFSAKDPGFFTISISTQSDQFEKCLKELSFVFKNFFHDGASVEELDRIISGYKSEEHYSLESVDRIASVAGHYNHFFGDVGFREEFLKQISLVTPKDVMAVAKKYLLPEKAKAFYFFSEKETNFKPRGFIEDMLLNYEEHYGQQEPIEKKISPRRTISQALSQPQKGLFLEKRLKTGARVILNLNYETPVVSLRVGFYGGIRKQKTSGLAELSSRIWVSESANYSEEKILEQSQALSSHISSFVGRDSLGFGLTTLSWNFDLMFDLLQDLILQPKNSERILERERKLILQEIALRADNPAQEAILGFKKAMFGTHPYAEDVLGTVESLEKITGMDVEDFIQGTRRGEDTLFVVSGALNNVDKFLDLLEELTQGFPTEIQKQESKSQDESPQKFFLERKKEQSHLVVGYRGLQSSDEQRYVLDVLQGVLSGQGGRLFLELRDKNSLAYTVAPLRMDGIDAGFFGAYIACSPDKVKKAYAMLKEEFLKLSHDEISDSELDGAKQCLLGQHDIGLQKNSSLSSYILSYALHGLPAQEKDLFKEKINRVTKKEIRELSQKIFCRPEVISLVGPQDSLV